MEISCAPRLIERLVQQKATGLYWKNQFEWTPNRNAARRFEDLLSVFEACHDHRLDGVRLVLKDLIADYEIQLDLDTATA